MKGKNIKMRLKIKNSIFYFLIEFLFKWIYYINLRNIINKQYINYINYK